MSGTVDLMSGHSKWRDIKHPARDKKLGYDEPVSAPEGEDFETVVRALLDVLPPTDQATSEEPEDSTGR